MAPGFVGWSELQGGPVDEVWPFYSELFGWRKDQTMDMGEMGPYQLFKVGNDNAVGAMMKRPDGAPGRFWLFYFTVPAIDAAAERVKAGGGQILNGPMEVPGGAWIVQCLDPEHAPFALVAPPKAA